MGTEEQALPLAWGWGQSQRPGLTKSADTQAYIQGFELAHHNIYPIHDPPELMKLLVLWNHGCWISMTQGSSRDIQEEFH